MITKAHVESKLEDFEKAVQTFKIIFDMKEVGEIEKDAALQRFEYSYELSWKTIKMYVTFRGGKEVKGSRDAIKEAYRFGLISNEKLWLDMMEDRNKTVHTYDMLFAREVFERLPDYCYAMIELLDELKFQLKND